MACVRGVGLVAVAGAFACGPVVGAPGGEAASAMGDESGGVTSAVASSTDGAGDDATTIAGIA